MRSIAIFILFLIAFTGNSQVLQDAKRDYSWLTGYTQYPPGSPGGSMWNFGIPNAPVVTPFAMNGFHLQNTNACISDSGGNFLFACNGFKVFGANHQLLPNGDSLSFSIWYIGLLGFGTDLPHGAMVLPLPGSDNTYYIFHQVRDYDFSLYIDVFPLLYYSIVQVDPLSGEARVTSKNNRLVQDYLSPGFAATRHANGRDWWIIQSDWSENNFYTILFTPVGIQSVTVQSHPWPLPNFAVPSKTTTQVFSPDGEKYVLSHFIHGDLPWGPGTGSIRVFNFDRCSGLLSGEREHTWPSPQSPIISASVSPNSRFLYYTMNMPFPDSISSNLYQFDLDNPDFGPTKTLVGKYDPFEDSATCCGLHPRFGNMQLGPDNKIYIESTTRWVHVVEQPDLAGTACNFKQRELLLPTFSEGSLPYFPNFRLGPVKGSLCDSLTIGIAENEGLAGAMALSPNPASGKVLLRLEGQAGQHEVMLTDLAGRPVMAKALFNQEISLDISHLAAGVYLLSVRPRAGAWVSRKLIVER